MGRLSVFVSMLLFVSAIAASTSAAEPVEDRFQIEIVTVDPGSKLFSRWGHISIVVKDKIAETRKAYNYGTFDFDDPGLRFRYARGYLNYWLSLVPYGLMIDYYIYQNRGVVSRTLNFTPDEAALVVEALDINLLPENRSYAYRHYLDNCCTRIRDLLDEMLGGAIKERFEKINNHRTYRFYTTRALKALPVMRNVILFILGREIDKPITRWEEQFLPEVFGEDLDRITIAPDNRPLVAQKNVFLDPVGPKAGETPAAWEQWVAWIMLSLLAVSFGLPFVVRKKRPSVAGRVAGVALALWGLIGGLGGLLVILLWIGTAHYDCHNNENVLVFPFTHLWLLGPGWMLMIKSTLREKSNRLLQRYLAVALGVLGLNLILKVGPFFQQNYQFIAFAALLNTAAILLLRVVIAAPISEKKTT